MKKICSLLLLFAMFVRLHGATPDAIPNGITAMTPPELELHPTPIYWARMRLWQGIPGVERAPNGRLWAVWYGGPLSEGEGQNFDVLETSNDDGKTWSQPVAVYDPSRNFLNGRTGDSMLWIDPNGKLWWFIQRGMKAPGGPAITSWCFYTDDPNVAKPVWKGPFYVGAGGILNKPVVLADGTWLLPINWHHNGTEPAMKRNAHVYKFKGYDQPWEHVGYANFPDCVFSEHMVVQRKDGSLWMLGRTSWGIAQADSQDGGKTWTVSETPFSKTWSVSTRFHFRRLNSGNLLLIANDTPKGRVNMTAFLSKDEGRTWSSKLLLDERKTSYPDAVETKGGFIYIIYDHGRYDKDAQEIVIAKITEADIEAGKVISAESYLKQTVNKLADEGGGVRFTGETEKLMEDYARLNPDSAAAKKIAKSRQEKEERRWKGVR